MARARPDIRKPADRNMRILVVTNMYPYSGSDHYGIFVREHVDALSALGVDIDVFFINPRDGRKKYASELPRLARTLADESYTILHAQHTYCAVQAALLKRLLGRPVPLVFTFHEGEARGALPIRRGKPDTLKRLTYWKRLKRWALEMSDYVISVDPLLVPATGYTGAYTVIAPAVDLALFRPRDKEVCRRHLDLPPDEPIVFFPGNPTRPEKGRDLFHAALERIDKPLHVVLGGDIARVEMPLYMNAADIVVQTSYFEASPMAVKEALACNTPVVSTDVGDVRSLIEGLPGCVCTPHDPTDIACAIVRALDCGGATSDGRERVIARKLSPKAVAKSYLEVYRRAMQRGPAERVAHA
jgi:glycosyltransferase involved in cell wall biosynthesis